MGNDAAAKRTDNTARANDTPPAAAPAENHGIKDAVREAWSGIGRLGHKAKDGVEHTYERTVEAIRSPEGQRAIKQGREGAAKAIETVGGRSNNPQVNKILENVAIVPGAGNVVRAAETLTDSGVTNKVRDGSGTVKKDVLIRGAIESAPMTGDAAKVKNLSDRTGVTHRIMDAFRHRNDNTSNQQSAGQQQNTETQEPPKKQQKKGS